MQPLQHCIDPTIPIGQEILCLPYAGFFKEGFMVYVFESLKLKEQN